jgi:hypothetical protein
MFFLYTSLYLAIIGVTIWHYIDVKYKGKDM